ncbi:YafY family protein [Actinomycetospora sp. OC33-EN08]|uniref:YafY family protein n=1 Tax=Actinomycetospora aurantiaca TaxID=3129233 RepID=A0ABU8MRE4_9PSEU
MTSPSVRMLELLSVLQDGREHTGADLAARLGASPRTVRRDLDRLRELGYPVESRRGPGGAYRLVAGSAVPPLLFTDDEAVAAVVGLRLVAGTGAADGALRKLEQVLPSRLAHRVRAVSSSLDAVSRAAVPLEVLQTLGAAIGARQDVRFTYVARSGEGSRRRVEPVRQVALARRWYLLGWDRDREDWRTFRLDRITGLDVPGTTFAERTPPDDPVSFVQASVSVPLSTTRAVVRFAAPAAVVSERLIAEAGAVEALGDDECRFVSAPDSWEWLAITLAMVGVPYVIEGPPELIERSREISSAMWRAAT